MIDSMTGFGGREAKILPFGKICIELRSSNHKFLETVLHLPEGFLFLEDRIKKEIEAKIKRGRVTCVVNIIGGQSSSVFINRGLLNNYILALREIKKLFGMKDEVSLDTLIHLPGVLSLEVNTITKVRIWSGLKTLLHQALNDLVKMRQKEGRALCVYLKSRAEALKTSLGMLKTRFKKVIQDKMAKLESDEERINFLKDTDITEETERLAFHIQNFINKLSQSGPLGKELDFIAQEMQREANTIGAKSCDALISNRVVNIKSQIEKIREQLQNIE